MSENEATAQPPLTRPGLLPIALSLGLGAVGGFAFSLMGVPLAWMLGPMVVNIAASIGGLPVLVPHGFRIVVLCVVGVFLGGAFTPELLSRAGPWLLSLSLMLVFVPLVSFMGYLYFRHVAGFDRNTAAFSGPPGTLSSMIIIGGASGADERLIVLAQGLRAASVVIVMPQIVSLMLGGAEITLPSGVAEAVNWTQAAMLIAAGATGWIISYVFNLPAGAMAGSMTATAALYLSGVVTYHPPDVMQSMAFWVLGSAVGSRFSTVSARTFFRVSKHALGATACMVALSAVFATLASAITGTPFLTELISFTPGGIPEMSLLAIAFDIDPAYVAVHHLTRIAILVIATPFIARMVVGKGLE